MATTANWTREETFKLISLWSEDVIQEQLDPRTATTSVVRIRCRLNRCCTASSRLCASINLRRFLSMVALLAATDLQ